MDIKDIIVKSDFMNLTNQEINKIIKILNIELNDGEDPRGRLFNNLNLIFENDKAKEILTDKIFAGRKSVKWFSIVYKDDIDNKSHKKLLIKNIESDEFCFNKTIDIDTQNLENPRLYTCIKLKDNIYIMRFMVPSGVKTYNNGEGYSKLKNIINAIVIINFDDKYLEIRTNSKNSRLIANQLKDKFKSIYIEDMNILKNYTGSLEKFKDSLYNGKFAESISMPNGQLKLTEENNELLVNTLLVIDDYFKDKDIKKFTDKIMSLNIDTDGTPFTQLLLAGMDRIGLKIRKDSERDLSKQTLYNILKEYITSYSGLIRFSEHPLGEMYTMSVGLKTYSIYFKSSVTEKTINYIREKVI